MLKVTKYEAQNVKNAKMTGWGPKCSISLEKGVIGTSWYLKKDCLEEQMGIKSQNPWVEGSENIFVLGPIRWIFSLLLITPNLR